MKQLDKEKIIPLRTTGETIAEKNMGDHIDYLVREESLIEKEYIKKISY